MTIKYASNQFLLKPFNIELDSYTESMSEKAKFKCTKCTYMWWSTMRDVQRTKHCPNCHKYNTYLIYFEFLDLYKIGYTDNVRRRITQFGYKAEIILVREHDTEYEARKLEQQWLNNVKALKVNTAMLDSGNTESFKIDF